MNRLPNSQREWDNMTPDDDPFEDMADDEIQEALEREAEYRYERRQEQ